MASSYPNYYYSYYYDYYQDKNESRPSLKKSLSTGTDYGYDIVSRDLMDEIEEIDPSCNEHLDGEPMNELELLAAKNAIINSKITKIVHTPTDNEQDEELTSIEQEFLNPTNDNSENHVMLVTNKEKKKRWPFSLLFKKAKQDIVHNYEANRSTHVIPDSHNNKSNDGNSINSSNSSSNSNSSSSSSSSNNSSNMPTPTLSPLSSTITSPLSSSSPFSFRRGVWVFRASSTDGMVYWIRFDPENQQKITHHFHSKNTDALYIFDSHLCRGQLPVLVLPFQKLCYYALDYAVSQVACLQLAYLPYR